MGLADTSNKKVRETEQLHLRNANAHMLKALVNECKILS